SSLYVVPYRPRRLHPEPVRELPQVKAFGGHMHAVRFPPAVFPRLKGARSPLSHMADGPVLRRRRLLRDQAAFRIPGHVVRTRPAVARAQILPVLEGDGRAHVVVEPADRPAVVRLAVGKIVIGRAVKEDVRAGHAGADGKGMAGSFRISP